MPADEHLSGAQFFHASPWALKHGTVLEPGQRPPTFPGAPDVSAVHMSTSESDAEVWGNAIASDTGASRIHIYEVEPHGEVSSKEQLVQDEEGFHNPIIEHMAQRATVRSLRYSFDPVTGEARYPEDER